MPRKKNTGQSDEGRKLAEKQLNQTLIDKFKSVRLNGMKEGCRAVSGVILQTVTREDMTDAEKLAEIKRFCQVGLGLKEVNTYNE